MITHEGQLEDLLDRIHALVNEAGRAQPDTPAGPIRVLIVDDDPIDRETLRRALRQMEPDADVTEAVCVETAMAALESGTFDCALVDHNLGRETGLAILPRLADAGTSAIMVTGRGDERTAVSAFRDGALDYVVKDVSGKHLSDLTKIFHRAVASTQRRRRRRDLLDRIYQTMSNTRDGNLMVVCAQCKSIRNKPGQWMTLERFLITMTGANLSHALCPGCYETALAQIGE